MNEAIPDRVLQLVLNFLREKRTGTITLNVKDGQILVLDLKESVRL